MRLSCLIAELGDLTDRCLCVVVERIGNRERSTGLAAVVVHRQATADVELVEVSSTESTQLKQQASRLAQRPARMGSSSLI